MHPKPDINVGKRFGSCFALGNQWLPKAGFAWENWGWGRAVGGNYEFCLRGIHSKNVEKAIGLVLAFCIRITCLLLFAGNRYLLCDGLGSTVGKVGALMRLVNWLI